MLKVKVENNFVKWIKKQVGIRCLAGTVKRNKGASLPLEKHLCSFRLAALFCLFNDCR